MNAADQPSRASAASAAARPPVVVLLGGPSAEHDVSVVSGTAIARALRDLGYLVEQILVDLDGRWWRLPAEHRRDDRPAAAYDDPASLGATGPWTVGAALDELAGRYPAPVVVIARPPLVKSTLRSPFFSIVTASLVPVEIVLVVPLNITVAPRPGLFVIRMPEAPGPVLFRLPERIMFPVLWF